MTVAEKIALREDVSAPAARAAAGVERLAGALGELGSANIDAGAAAKIERISRKAADAQDRATAAAKRAALIRESASKAEDNARIASERAATATRDAGERAAEAAKKAARIREDANKAAAKAAETAENAARLREAGVRASKADREAARTAAKAARLRIAAEKAEEIARKRAGAVARAQSVAERQAEKAAEKAAKQRGAAERAESTAKKRASIAERARSDAARAQSKAEAGAVKAAEKAKKRAEKEEKRRAKGLAGEVTKAEARLWESIQKFNPAQERREAMLERQLRRMKESARAGIDQQPDDEGGWGTFKRGIKAAALVEIGSQVASAGGRAAFGFAKAAIDAAAFREDATGALRNILKTGDAADRAMRTAMATADFIGQGRRETLSQYVNLLGQRFSAERVDQIVRSMADLGTVNPEANVDGILRAIGKIKAQGKLQGDELMMLAEAGLSVELVYKHLARILGKTVDEVKKMQPAGKLEADPTTQAILDAVKEMSGGRAAGLAAREKSIANMSGLMARIQAIPGNLLGDLEVTPGMRAYKDFLGGIVDSLDPSGPRWQRIKGVLGRVVNSAFGSMFGGKDPGALVDRIITKLETAAPIISAAMSGFSTGFSGAIRVFDQLDKFAGDGPLGSIAKVLGIDKVPWIELVARGVGLIAGVAGVALATIGAVAVAWVGFTTTVYGGILATYGAIAEVAEAVYAFFSGETLAAKGSGLGVAIVDGMVGGIKGGAARVTEAIAALAGGTIITARKTLRIGSPSREFMAIGGYLSEGAAIGITGGAARVIRAAESMAMATTRAANDNMAGTGAAVAPTGRTSPARAHVAGSLARGAGGGFFNYGTIEINVTVQGDGGKGDAEEIARGVWAELQRLAEEGA
ncbi:tape measure protein [Polyangium sp. 6x1]|uniref:tape measure protein n=1 Tax=Polyangium sp. 6x1 TaxID=3042689 RepID=UPI0024830789|nr:tape measure protein [Polyangium sp. 6x1]MDI1445779.1 tape measure protein [Polyangium sp. 6x1]